MESMSVSILGIWYLFLCIILLGILDSKVIFNVRWSLLTLITIAEMEF